MKILVTGGLGCIGQVLTEHLRQCNNDVYVWDTACSAGYLYDYQHLAPNGFSTIIHLAAHSSVAMCDKAPADAVDNNLLNVGSFVRELGEDQTFIFASTGSIHDRNTSSLYDATKRAAEIIIPVLHPKSYILRFGTVCGVSPKMRGDLILNGMVRDAVRTGKINVWNPGAWRPVLFFLDLCYAVEHLLDGAAPYGVYNLASFQAKIGGWADMVAKQTGAEISDMGISPHYDFRMNVLPKSLTTPEEVIDELARYWRDHS